MKALKWSLGDWLLVAGVLALVGLVVRGAHARGWSFGFGMGVGELELLLLIVVVVFGATRLGGR